MLGAFGFLFAPSLSFFSIRFSNRTSQYDKWIRLDARGNKEGVNAQFSLDTEQLAFPVRTEMGEEDNYNVYSAPDAEILKALRAAGSRTVLWDNLPSELGCSRQKGSLN